MNTQRFLDFHCHLDLYPEFENLVIECEKEKIYTLTVTTTPRAWIKNYNLTKNLKYVRAALGLHPQLVKHNMVEDFLLWKKYFLETKYIGEVGLDASANFFHTMDAQKRVFIQILKCCAEVGGKILSVHSLRCATKTLDLIESNLPAEKGSVVLHWFTGDNTELRRAMRLGCYFSINIKMAQSARGKKIIEKIPLDKMFTETDGPFIEYGGKTIKPGDVATVIDHIAKIKKIAPSTVKDIIYLNLKNLLG